MNQEFAGSGDPARRGVRALFLIRKGLRWPAMSEPSAPNQELLSAPTWRREPYRPLFALGAVLLWAGIAPWLLYGLGTLPGLEDAAWLPGYESIAHSIIDRLDSGTTVVAACSSLKRAYRDLFRERIGGPLGFVYLEATPPVIEARIRARNDHFMPASLVESQFASLETPLDEPDVLILPSDDDPDRLVAAVLGWRTMTGSG